MILAFAGRIGAGKSTISKAVADHYSVKRASFGDTVRHEAERRGINETRVALQDLGDQLIAGGWDDFCTLVTDSVDWDRSSSLVVDGVRHHGAIEALRRLAAPSRLHLVFIDTPWDRRKAWLIQKGQDVAEVLAADAHPNESELSAVMWEADMTVSNDGSIDEAVELVISALYEIGGLP